MTTKTNGALAPITIGDALNKTLETPSLDPVLLSVANEFLGGNDISDIAQKFDISPDRVTQIVEKKEVKSYIDNVYLTQGYLNRIKRINIINNVIEQKLAEYFEVEDVKFLSIDGFLKVLQSKSRYCIDCFKAQEGGKS